MGFAHERKPFAELIHGHPGMFKEAARQGYVRDMYAGGTVDILCRYVIMATYGDAGSCFSIPIHSHRISFVFHDHQISSSIIESNVILYPNLHKASLEHLGTFPSSLAQADAEGATPEARKAEFELTTSCVISALGF